MRSAGKVLETPTIVTSDAFRPARSAARSTRSCTAATFSATALGEVPMPQILAELGVHS